MDDSANAHDPLRTVVVSRRAQLTDDIIELTLAPAAGKELVVAEPGAHIRVHLGGEHRAYSLCSVEPHGRTWTIAIARDRSNRGFSAMLHDRAVLGTMLEVTEPFNNFQLLQAPRYVFIAGGIGITPLLPMIETVTRDEAEWELVYVGKRRTAMAYLDQLVDRHGDAVRVHTSEQLGRLDLKDLVSQLPADAMIYACGPDSLLDDLESVGASWPPGRLRVERFQGGVVHEPSDQAFPIEFARTELQASVGPDQTVLEVAESLGIFVDVSCEEGTCGSCLTRVLAGEVDHRDFILTPEERTRSEVMYVCVSRSKHGSPLVLDL